MDPLSVTASIIAVLQAANSVISFCFDFYSAVNDRPWGLTILVQEITQLRKVLEALRNVSELAEMPAMSETKPADAESRLPMLKVLCQPNGPLETCLLELKRLGNKLMTLTAGRNWTGNVGRLSRAVVQAVGWRMKREDVEKTVLMLERFKTTFNLALTADEATLLLSIEGKLVDLADNVISARADERHKSILQWLAPVNSEQSHMNALKAHQPGTCQWFLESNMYQEWKIAEHSFLWISGFPGAGKTVLSQDPLHVIGSLIAQLCVQDDRIPACIQEQYYKNSQSPGPPRRPEYSLLEEACAEISESHQTKFVIDALDECESRKEILDFLLATAERSKSLSIMVTSRDQKETRYRLENLPRICLDAQSQLVAKDILLYIQSRLDTEIEMQWLNPQIRGEIEEKLSSSKNGSWMFRWVQCQLDELSKLRQIKSIRKALTDLPQGLETTYERILQHVPHGNVEIVQRSLLWLSFNVLPLSLADLWEAIAIEEGLSGIDEASRLSSPGDIVDICGSLIRVSANNEEVTLAHLSVREYILSNKILESPVARRFALNPTDANNELALLCLTYLSYDPFKHGPVKTELDWQKRIKHYPMMQYASVSWPYHAARAGQPPKLNTAIREFFKAENRQIYKSWVQALHWNHWSAYPQNYNPLYYAASFGLDKIVLDLIKGGVDLNASGSRYGGTALHAAALRQHVRVIELLLEAGADASKPDDNHITPLHTAASRGIPVIKMLLSYGANVTSRTQNHGLTPYDWAVLAGRDEAAMLLSATTKEKGKSPSED